MDRQLTIESKGENFLLKFHNYEGPFEGHQITRELGVEEVDAPADGTPASLQVGQGFLLHAMEYHPDLLAVVSPDRMKPLAILVDRHNVTVVKGQDYLPSLKIEHPDENYIEYIEKLHVPVWHRGPRAVLGAFLVRALPAVAVIVALLVASRHYGDHYQDVTVDELFAQAGRPTVQQGAVAAFFDPDHSHLVRLKVRSIRFMEGNTFVMADGNYLAVDGLERIQPIFEMAGSRNSAPTFDIDLQSGEAFVQQLRLGDDVQARNLVLRRIAALGPSDAMPARGDDSSGGKFQELRNLPYDDTAVLEQALGSRISLSGTLEAGGEGTVLQLDGGSRVVLDASQASQPMTDFLAAFRNGTTKLNCDVVLRTIYDWKDRNDPARSRGETKLIGEATIYSASAQNYHIVARR